MGTNVEQPSRNGNGACCSFEIDGPDADGFVWLRWTDPDGTMQSKNLGAYEAVAQGWAEWMARTDFGEGSPGRARIRVDGVSARVWD